MAASGLMVHAAKEAATMLQAQGICAEVLDVHTIKPIDKETLLASIKKTGCVVSCENHNVLGGLGAAIAEVVTQNNPVPMEYIGFQDCFGEAADQDYLMERFHLQPSDIVTAALKVMARK